MLRLFLDANVLFTAAHNPDGKAAFLFAQPPGKHWTLVSSVYAIEECRRNLAAKVPAALPRFESLMKILEIAQQPATLPQQYVLVEKDRPILAAALAAGATHLLTGDRKDFGHLMNRPDRAGGLQVQTVADFLTNLLST